MNDPASQQPTIPGIRPARLPLGVGGNSVQRDNDKVSHKSDPNIIRVPFANEGRKQKFAALHYSVSDADNLIVTDSL